MLRILIVVACLWGVAAQMMAISLSKELSIPGNRYSLINMSHQNSNSISSLYNVNITFLLSQITEKDQTNSIFDFMSAERGEYKEFIRCYNESIYHLTNLYEHYEPCQTICSFDNVSSLRYETRKSKFNISVNGNQNFNQTMIIDNTFFPCEDGAYQPILFLFEEINIVIESNLQFEWVAKLVFVGLLQLLIILLAYILIMCNKLGKKRDKYLKLKQQSEVKKFLVDSFIIKKNELV